MSCDKINNKSVAFFIGASLQFKSVDVSQDLIVYGTEKNTGALFIYRRSPYSFLRAVPGNVIRGELTQT